MKINKLAGDLLFAGGVFELLIGVAHFLMPIEIVKSVEFTSLNESHLDFIILSTLAIGLCATLFGILSIYFSKKIRLGDMSAYYFGLSQAVLWIFRLVLEIVYPVRVTLIQITNPTVIVIPIVITIMFLFIIPVVIFRKTVV